MRDDENFNSGMRDKNAWRERDLCILTGKMRDSFEMMAGSVRLKNRKSHLLSS